jgi:hypothetical protein
MEEINMLWRVVPNVVLLLCLWLWPSQITTNGQIIRSEWDPAIAVGAVNERPVRLLLDTGADASGIDEEVLVELHIAPQHQREVIAPSGKTLVTMYEPVEIAIDGFDSIRVQPAGIDLAPFSPSGHPAFDGVAGLDVLRHQTVVISNGVVSFHDGVPSAFGIVNTLTGGEVMDDGAKLPISIPGLGEGRFRVDTGMMDACLLTDRLGKELIRRRCIVRAATVEVTDVRGGDTVDNYVLRELTVAGVRFRNVPVSIGQTNAIGLELLRHVNLALDFPRRQIVVGKPPQAVVDGFAMNASGMAVVFDVANVLKVFAIRPDSHAETADVQVGDIIVRLDGKNPAELSIYDIHDILARNGKTISVVFRRDKDERHIELPLRLPFEYPPNWAALDARQEDFEKFLEKLESDPVPAAMP